MAKELGVSDRHKEIPSTADGTKADKIRVTSDLKIILKTLGGYENFTYLCLRKTVTSDTK